MAKTVEAPSPNHWTASEFPDFSMLSCSLLEYPRLRYNLLAGMASIVKLAALAFLLNLAKSKISSKGMFIFLVVPAFPCVDSHSTSSSCLCSFFVFNLVWLPCAGSSPHPPAQSFPLVVEILSSVKHRNFMCSLSEYEIQPLIQSLLILMT